MEEKPGRKFWIALIFGAALVVVLVILLIFGVRDVAILLAWLAAFTAIPTQFSITNAAITKSFAASQEKK